MITLIPGLMRIPPNRHFNPNDYTAVPDGTVIIQGELGHAFADVFGGIDVEFILDERTSTAFWSNDHFRVALSGRVRVIKRDGMLVVEPAPDPLIPERKELIIPGVFNNFPPGQPVLEGEVFFMVGYKTMRGYLLAYIVRDGVAYCHPAFVAYCTRRVRVYVNEANDGFYVEELPP